MMTRLRTLSLALRQQAYPRELRIAAPSLRIGPWSLEEIRALLASPDAVAADTAGALLDPTAAPVHTNAAPLDPAAAPADTNAAPLDPAAASAHTTAEPLDLGFVRSLATHVWRLEKATHVWRLEKQAARLGDDSRGNRVTGRIDLLAELLRQAGITTTDFTGKPFDENEIWDDVVGSKEEKRNPVITAMRAPRIALKGTVIQRGLPIVEDKDVDHSKEDPR